MPQYDESLSREKIARITDLAAQVVWATAILCVLLAILDLWKSYAVKDPFVSAMSICALDTEGISVPTDVQQAAQVKDPAAYFEATLKRNQQVLDAITKCREGALSYYKPEGSK